MKLTQEEGREIVQDDHEDWKIVENTKNIVDHRRWAVEYEAVFCHVPSGKHYKLAWEAGATENQDTDPFEFENPAPIEVVQEEQTCKVWVPTN